MKPVQLDMFGNETAHFPVDSDGQDSGETGAKRGRAGKRRKRSKEVVRPEVAKAPLIMDSFGKKSDSFDYAAGLENLKAEEINYLAEENIIASDAVSAATPKIYSISEITSQIKGMMESKFPNVWITGEVTDFRNRTSRHYYFALKDDKAKIRATIFNAASRRFPFELADGMELICHGSIDVYGPQGSYSIIVDHCEPKGIGALQLAFEQLKKRLEAEGLFAPERKRPIPFLPRRVGVVTSPTGAAVRDIIHVLKRRFPNVDILLYPVRVQGEGAAKEIADAIDVMNRSADVDVLIVGRGGGSIEDLWAFNEEIVARAIVASRIPVISAVGHEIDFTIADFCADRRAATPSAAAEIAVPVREELINKIVERRRSLAQALRQSVSSKKQDVAKLANRIGDPRRRFPDMLRRIDELFGRFRRGFDVALERRSGMLSKFVSNLDHLSPLGVLAKGYAVVQDRRGESVRKASQLKIGDNLSIRLHRGEAAAIVTKLKVID